MAEMDKICQGIVKSRTMKARPQVESENQATPKFDEEWRTDEPPKPKRLLDVAIWKYFWQRGATVGYESVEGEKIEYTLKGWRVKEKL